MADRIRLASLAIDEDTLGKGWGSPLAHNPNTGDFYARSGEELLTLNIQDLISTRVGERVFNEDYGVDVPQRLFSDPDVAITVLAPVIREAIELFEPRVRDVSVSGYKDPKTPTIILFDVAYTPIATRKRVNKVFPYTLGGA